MNCWNFGKWDLLGHAHIADDLGKYFQIADQISERLSSARDDFHDMQSCEQSISGGCVAIEKQNMSGLLSAKLCAAALHFFQNVLVSDIGAQHANAGCLEG